MLVQACVQPWLREAETLTVGCLQVGDDAASAAFKAWWESEGVPRGGRLCYNSGRALVRYRPAAVQSPLLQG